MVVIIFDVGSRIAKDTSVRFSAESLVDVGEGAKDLVLWARCLCLFVVGAIDALSYKRLL